VASKYAGLKGVIPEQQSQRDAALDLAIVERRTKTVAELTEEYNQVNAEAATLSLRAKVVGIQAKALEILIRKKLDADDADAIRINGYTWSETFEPYPIAQDPAVIEQYFREHGMEDQLRLTATELATRLKNHVKQEALANELIVQEIPNPDNPGTTITEVRSQIPGVKVFLKAGLSRVKSGKGASA
jgi:hypothetical protein